MKKVLVVDDFSSVRLYHCKMIQNLGYEAFQAESISQARAILAREKIDLILLDLLMPDEDGRAFIESEAASRLPPTIVITSESEDYGAKNLSLKKARCVLTKPVRPQNLQNAVKAALDSRN